MVDVASVGTVAPADESEAYAVLGSVVTLASGLGSALSADVLQRAAVLYGYLTEDREASLKAVGTLSGTRWNGAPSPESALVSISSDQPDLTGPMSGIQATVPVTPDVTLLVPASGDSADAILSVDEALAFFRVMHGHVPAYISASTEVPDLDAPVGRNYYDVKSQFFSAVPLVMFVTAAFRGVAWRPNELGACLIIDDPLLTSRYGFCDFGWLRNRMRDHRFTTSVAFIPWNWRRTSRRSSVLFRTEPDLFSVSSHG